MQRLCAIPAAPQRLRERVHLGTGPAEDDCRRGRFQVQDPPERGHLVGTGHDVGDLAHPRRRAGGDALRGDREPHGIVQAPLGEPRDARRHRGREERGLPCLGHGVEQALQLFGESHVEHLVRLVQHDRRKARQVERAARQVIQGPARRGDDHVHAPAQRADLLRKRLAPIDRDDLGAERAAIAVHRLGDLHRELPGGHEDELVRPRRRRRAGRQALQERQGECRRLARPGGGLPEQVPARQQRRDRLGLDGSGFLVAQLGEGGDQAGDEPELGEGVGHAAM